MQLHTVFDGGMELLRGIWGPACGGCHIVNSGRHTVGLWLRLRPMIRVRVRVRLRLKVRVMARVQSGGCDGSGGCVVGDEMQL